jgi:EAL domain-containing protein (putative c-di-GMP-specific phosphodiesterase class I)
MQGYFFSRPLPARDLSALLSARVEKPTLTALAS